MDVTYQGITGAAAIALKGGSSDAPRLTPQNGQPPLIIAGPDVGRSLTESAQQTLRHIDGILDQNAKPLNTAITGIAAFAEMLVRNSQRVEGLIGGLESLTGTGTPKPGPAIYDLASATTFPQIDKPIKAQLIVPDPNAIILFDSQKILLRNGEGTYTNINNAQWADNLPKLVQARIVQSFENARQLSRREPAARSAQRTISTGAYDPQFSAYLEPSPKAVVDVTARLVSDKGAIAGARVFTASIAAKSAEASDAVAALNEAFSKVAGEIVGWTAGTI